MMNVIRFFVEVKGVVLPDGTVWGGGTEEKIRVVSESGVVGFVVYDVIGEKTVNAFGSGVRVDWKEMKEKVNEMISYQISIGNKVLRGGQEITEI